MPSKTASPHKKMPLSSKYLPILQTIRLAVPDSSFYAVSQKPVKEKIGKNKKSIAKFLFL